MVMESCNGCPKNGQNYKFSSQQIIINSLQLTVLDSLSQLRLSPKIIWRIEWGEDIISPFIDIHKTEQELRAEWKKERKMINVQEIIE